MLVSTDYSSPKIIYIVVNTQDCKPRLYKTIQNQKPPSLLSLWFCFVVYLFRHYISKNIIIFLSHMILLSFAKTMEYSVGINIQNNKGYTMIIAWGFFIISTFLFLIWMTELIPSLSDNKLYAGWNILLWFTIMLISAQYIWS